MSTQDYRIASDIRAYINAAVESGSEEATSEWIEWARKKADWHDPTIVREDEYLGRRNHGKSKDEKDLDRVSVRRSWGWCNCSQLIEKKPHLWYDYRVRQRYYVK